MAARELLRHEERALTPYATARGRVGAGKDAKERRLADAVSAHERHRIPFELHVQSIDERTTARRLNAQAGSLKQRHWSSLSLDAFSSDR
ncbi:MAG: hypothetical protein AAF411_03005 [Myxococcota bacterium]